MSPSETSTRTFSARLPEDDYEVLRAYAFFTGSSMNDVVLRAIRAYLAEHGRGVNLDSVVESSWAKFRERLDRLREP